MSPIIEIIKGDDSSVKGLLVLLNTLRFDERQKLITFYVNENIFNKHIINILEENNLTDVNTKKNYFRLLRILFSIFTNPYGINNKSPKKHIYERTGALFYRLGLYKRF